MDILGINFSLDAAAAFLRDGAVLAAVTDERFTGRKHSRDFPSASIDYCLRTAGVDLDGVDAVAFFWNPGIHLQSFNVRRSAAMRHHSELLASVPNHLLARYPGRWDETVVEQVEQTFAIRGARKPLRIVYVTHHHAHAASAFFVSPFEEAAILTVDGYGEQTSTFLAHGRGPAFQEIGRTEFPHSLGAFYAAVTQYLGFAANCDEGKVMGLAAHGEPRFAADLAEIVRPIPDGGFEIDLSYFAYHQERPRRYSAKLMAQFGAERRADEPLGQRHRDFAASAQKVLEDTLIHVARHLREATGQRRLCLAGGVALNCVANSRVLEEAGFDEAFIQPAAGDNGTSLGAALYVHHQLHGRPRGHAMVTDALGPSFSDADIERELRENRLRFERSEDIARLAAERLAAGDILGWFQGRVEFGPRALGNRSILADPRRADVKKILDDRVKRREPFRPYAPSVLAEAQSEYFTGPGDSPFMIKNFTVRPEKRGQIPAVVHVDGSARVQTVTEGENPLYWRLIKEFGRLTGVPVVLNTSFNGRGETMVCTVRDALRCFYSCGLDSLAIGSFLVRK
jgi:carbamoyltransferase